MHMEGLLETACCRIDGDHDVKAEILKLVDPRISLVIADDGIIDTPESWARRPFRFGVLLWDHATGWLY